MSESRSVRIDDIAIKLNSVPLSTKILVCSTVLWGFVQKLPGNGPYEILNNLSKSPISLMIGGAFNGILYSLGGIFLAHISPNWLRPIETAGILFASASKLGMFNH